MQHYRNYHAYPQNHRYGDERDNDHRQYYLHRIFHHCRKYFLHLFDFIIVHGWKNKLLGLLIALMFLFAGALFTALI